MFAQTAGGCASQAAFPGARGSPASCIDEDGLSSPGSLTIKGRVFVLHFSTGSYKFSFSEDWGGERLGTGSIVTPSPCRFMVKLAEETDGIIVTNEQLHVLMNNSKKLMVKDR